MRCSRLLPFVCFLMACREAASSAPAQIQMEWAGSTGGTFAAPLTLTHCAATGLVELLAVRGDTGFGGALFLRDSSDVAVGDYPVVLGATYPEPRPGAVTALRWFNNVSITGFEGVEGAIRLTRSDSQVSGTLDFVLQGIEHPDTLRVTGRFDRVPLVRADTGCAATMRRNTL